MSSEFNVPTESLSDVMSTETAAAVLVPELADGDVISSPVYSEDGRLLLAANVEVTPQVKRLLTGRATRQPIQVARPDEEPPPTKSKTALEKSEPQNGRETAKRPQRVIDSGMFSVSNRGPAVADRIVRLGLKDYDPRQRKRLFEMHRRNGVVLTKTIERVLEGHSLNASHLVQIASSYLDELEVDADSVLTSRLCCQDDDDSPMRFLHVAIMSMAIGIEMGFDDDNVRKLGVGGLVCDWGMARVSEKIRYATRHLTANEFIEIKKHPIYSLEMLERISGLPEVVRIVAYQSHESPNGTGYPRRRMRASIHPFARIVRVADTFLALTDRRPYRPPLMRHAAMECLVREANEGIVDVDAVLALLRVLSLYPLGCNVRLSDGSRARVLRRNGDDYSHPIVKRLLDADGRRIDASAGNQLVDLAQSNLSIKDVLPSDEREEISLDTAGLLEVETSPAEN